MNPDLLQIHTEDAAFLLSQRALACEAPNYRLEDLYDLDQRLAGHLDGLICGGVQAARIALAEAELTEAADAAGVLLHVGLRLGLPDLIEAAFGLGRAAPDQPLRLAEAAACCAPAQLSAVMSGWLTGRDPLPRTVALHVCRIARADPFDHLARALGDPDPGVMSAAARLAGELGRADLLPLVRDLPGDEAALASVLLGDAGAAQRLGDPARFPGGAMARRFAEVLPLALPRDEAAEGIAALLADPATRRWGTVAIGTLGWSGGLTTLLRLMEEPSQARVAVSAFEQITGLYVAHEDMELEDFPDDPDGLDLSAVESFAEAGTPWPDPELFARWIDSHQKGYPEAERLLLGLAAWTWDGAPGPEVRYQARHRWIAITQALRAPGAALPNWTSPPRVNGAGFGRAW
ncbi:hypothetical protein KO516_03345 [Citreicella sp. C3M06]|uniref:hypothetical protein n=1 Tax=Roseobacteraceae TaxID=2854170 RepID=UPI001C099CEA|nr:MULTISPECIES: hypothetical protein [Roseobacteraceae]MBU2959875.1 hypothetical protein [Citreicella sp. C3M06]MDO6587958.1 hypothetical protein [Salipiger sp. 1_MG-2023]